MIIVIFDEKHNDNDSVHDIMIIIRLYDSASENDIHFGPRTLITTLAKQALSDYRGGTVSGVQHHTPFAPGTCSPPISYSHQAYSYPHGDPLISQSFDASNDVETSSESFRYVLSTVT